MNDESYKEVLNNIVNGVVVFDAGKSMQTFDPSKMIEGIDLKKQIATALLISSFLNRHGADKNGVLKMIDPRGKPVFMSSTTFTSSKTGKSKLHKGNRWRYLNYLPEVVQDADFIIEYQQGGSKTKRVYYYKNYNYMGKQQGFLIVVGGQNVEQSISAYNLTLPSDTPINFDIKRKLKRLMIMMKKGEIDKSNGVLKMIFPEEKELY